MPTMRMILSKVSAVWRLADSRVLTMLSAVMSQVAMMAKIWDQSKCAKAGCDRKLSAEKLPSTRMRPAAMVAMDAGLAMVIQVQV